MTRNRSELVRQHARAINREQRLAAGAKRVIEPDADVVYVRNLPLGSPELMTAKNERSARRVVATAYNRSIPEYRADSMKWGINDFTTREEDDVFFVDVVPDVTCIPLLYHHPTRKKCHV